MAAQQVEFIAFPETLLSGYPSWLEHTGAARFDDAMQRRAYAAYLDAAVEVTGPEILLITEAARDLGIFVYLGTIERDVTVGRGTVYCTLVAIDPRVGVVGTHRKLMPTDEERLIVADIDLAEVRAERLTVDPTGHYSRPDVFTVDVDRRRRAASRFQD